MGDVKLDISILNNIQIIKYLGIFNLIFFPFLYSLYEAKIGYENKTSRKHHLLQVHG